MWEGHAAGEDILALLSKEGHGQTVIVEPSSVEAGGLYGATFIRLDGETILKLRTPLNEGFRVIEEEKQDEGLGLPDLPLPPGSLPPLWISLLCLCLNQGCLPCHLLPCHHHQHYRHSEKRLKMIRQSLFEHQIIRVAILVVSVR